MAGDPTRPAPSRTVLPAALWRLICVQTLMNGSHFMAMPLLAVFCSQALEMPATMVGAVMAVYFVAARVTPVFVAPLADRYGLWPAVIIGLFLRGSGFIGFYLVSSEAAALLMSATLGLGTAIYEAGAYGVIGAQPRVLRERLIVINAQGLNIGCVIGPLAGAGIAVFDVALPILLSGILFLLLTAGALLERSAELRTHEPRAVRDSIGMVTQDRPFLLLCLALIPWWALFAQLFAAFPIEAAARGGSAGWAGSVLAVNGAIGFLILFTVPVFIRRLGLTGVLIVGAGLGGLSIAGVGISSGLPPLLLLVAIFSCAEIAILAAAEVLVGRHAAGKSVATFFAMFNVSWGLGGAIGGAIGPIIASLNSPVLVWALAGSSSILVIIGVTAYWMIAPAEIVNDADHR